MKEDMIVFGCLHSNTDALETILCHSEQNKINVALNLGDESGHYGGNGNLRKIYTLLKGWRDASPERRLICIAGWSTRDIIPELRKNYVGMDEEGKVKGRGVFKEDNVLAAHDGRDILMEHGDLIRHYSNPEPLMVFQGHLHSMNVSREYKWLKDNEKVRFMKEGEKHWTLSDGAVYWVSPGRASWRENNADGDEFKAVNFALYNPKERRVTLKSVFS